MLNAAKDGQKIYGLIVGVGLNKDKKFVDAKGNLDAEVIKASTDFILDLFMLTAVELAKIYHLKLLLQG